MRNRERLRFPFSVEFGNRAWHLGSHDYHKEPCNNPWAGGKGKEEDRRQEKKGEGEGRREKEDGENFLGNKLQTYHLSFQSQVTWSPESCFSLDYRGECLLHVTPRKPRYA